MALDLFPVDGPWPGRLAVCGRPRSGHWLDDDLRALKAQGFDVLVSAITVEELAKLHLRGIADACRRHTLEHVHVPIGNLMVPTLESALPLLHNWSALLDAGRGIAMHCWGSVGRSPTLAASLLVLRGVPAAEAWERVEIARGREVPDTLEQRRWVEQFIQSEDIRASLA